MLDLSSTPDEFLEPIACVVEATLRHADSLRSEDVMVVGAWCRDIQHHALGHPVRYQRYARSGPRTRTLLMGCLPCSGRRVPLGWRYRYQVPHRGSHRRPSPIRRNRRSARHRATAYAK